MEPEFEFTKKKYTDYLHLAVSRFNDHLDVKKQAICYQDCVRYLDKGANVNASSKCHFVLADAAGRGSLELCKLFIDRGAKIDARVRNNATALIEAASNGNVAICSLLIEHGADVNARDPFDNTALIFAAGKGEVGLCRELIGAGADLDSQDRKRWTPLHHAAHGGRAEACQLLLERGANINAETINGNTPEELISVGRPCIRGDKRPCDPAATKAVFDAYRLAERLEANTPPAPTFPDLNDPATLDQVAQQHEQHPKRRGMRL